MVPCPPPTQVARRGGAVKPRPRHSVVVALLLTVGISLLVLGCMGGGQATVTTQSVGSTQALAQQTPSTQTSTTGRGNDAEALSTFKSKDPFIQQALPTTTTTTSVTPTTPTTSSGGPSTTFFGTTTTFHGGTTSTTAQATTTTAPHRHSIKVLSVAVVGGSAAVTLQVDNSVYKDKRVGDVMSTSWGQVKVLDLSTASKVATLLHSGETIVLAVGQQIYE
jgi:hypothetical protein